eukprot:TRINITY_DN47490_c0_g1_i1.p1 TRINITY_DN47490_c0_g1~~TRINITY_DN47490_c0_g1_i1.p1  ORF type:complete len:449 (-),score=61.73 TRINITY_DN47490_c0_g1_i1:68-1333(-)
MAPFLPRALSMLVFVWSLHVAASNDQAAERGLVRDDQCAADPRECALTALQLRGQRVASGNNASEARPLPLLRVHSAWGCGNLQGNYSLSWKAMGQNFFDQFTFVTQDDTHGAQRYLTREEAFRTGVASSNESRARIRVGEVVGELQRASVRIHSKQAWRPDRGFLVVMKYKHVPYGPGLWPALWMMNSDLKWPAGGELDILEYANDEANKVTFHTSKNCFLSRRKLWLCMRSRPGRRLGDSGPVNCNTNYFKNLLGCRPRQMRHTGQWYAENPGIVAALWDANGISAYHIPEAEIPGDLIEEQPLPESWRRWRIAFLPFDQRTCFDMAKPQEIVLNIALCGDWAGGAWARSRMASHTGFAGKCQPGPLCCARFAAGPASEEPYRRHAHFDIDYLKVFEPSGQPTELYSGTYRRGGKLLSE